MKKILIAMAIFAVLTCSADRHHYHRPPHRTPVVHRGPAPRPAPRPMPKPMPRSVVHHHAPYHSHSAWGPGGRNFWPGFIGGLVGSTLVGPSVVVTPPPPPGPYVRQVWIEGHYEVQVINGIYTQVWIPGRWAVVR